MLTIFEGRIIQLRRRTRLDLMSLRARMRRDLFLIRTVRVGMSGHQIEIFYLGSPEMSFSSLVLISSDP